MFPSVQQQQLKLTCLCHNIIHELHQMYSIPLTTSFSRHLNFPPFLQVLATYFHSPSRFLIHLSINVNDNRSSTSFLLSTFCSSHPLAHTLNVLKVQSIFLGGIYTYNTSNPLHISTWMSHRHLQFNTLKTYFPSKVAPAALPWLNMLVYFSACLPPLHHN